tara:strand:+ start:123 stop:8006 length:7884 start_codon:yes stop_codon:yes gene_type:complete
MSIKDLFNNKGVPKIQKTATSDDLVATVESSEFVEAKRKQHDQFIPPIDFATASNFAKFGSAELYYEKAFERIHNYYPYDGTLHEKIEFENSSSYLDKYVFDNLYPRTNGYLVFSDQYISVFGGPHTASAGMIGKTLDSTFDLSMKYDEEKKRTSAFEFRGEDGITIEAWLKPDSVSGVPQAIAHVSGINGQILLQQNGSQLNLTVNSGSSGTLSFNSPTNTLDTDWNHYAVTLLSSSSGLTSKAFKNGQLLSQETIAGNSYHIPDLLPTSDSLNMRVGNNFDLNKQFQGSMDEFRFWKKARTTEQIFNNWFIPIGGGTNKHDANIDLSCYFKFNEGKTGNDTLDSRILDYSGRINNGQLTGSSFTYSSAYRNTGSAIREKLNEPEFLDPIIYSSHPDVVSKKAEYKTSGSLADLENTSMVYSYFPGWMQEEDTQNGKQLKYLSQVIGSYFDTLWHQISFVDKIHDNHYIQEGDKALPFAKKLLYNKGFVIPDMFVDATLVENLRQKDDNEIYEKEINEVRNIIYHNLYNNLDGIYKSKGTEKAFRNFFRSLGIGQDVVKLKMYADDSTFVLRNNYEYKSYGRNFLNFNVDGHFDGTIYQTTSSNNSNIYIPGDSNFTGSFTLQAEVILPRKQRSNEPNYNPYPYLTASIAGFHRFGNNYTHNTNQATAANIIQFLGANDGNEFRILVPSNAGGTGTSTTIRLRTGDSTGANANNGENNTIGVGLDGLTLPLDNAASETITNQIIAAINDGTDGANIVIGSNLSSGIQGLSATTGTSVGAISLTSTSNPGTLGHGITLRNDAGSIAQSPLSLGGAEDSGLQIYAIHSASEGGLSPDDKQRVKFLLTGSEPLLPDISLETDWFPQQYENNKWSLAVRLKHATYPTPNITGTTIDDYLLEFYGVEADGNTERNSFSLSTPSIAHSYYSSDKIFYAGAHKTNFTGSTLQHTDVKLGYLRYWHSYLSNDAIRQHAFDSETFGANEPLEQDLIDVYPVEIPREKTLAFHWAFHDLTSSDASGRFSVSDLSSGSSDSNYGSLSNTIERYIAAYGIGFNNSSSKIVDKNFLYSARKRLPDDLMSSDLTIIKTDETEQFFVDEDVSDNFYSFEKSMWGTISDEMMSMFSTALDLNNLIGQPNQRYHHKYALADFLRDRFFEDVENEPDIEKFTSFYKWIDDSISIALQQLVPASARFSEKINNVIESHVLERSKYVHQIPITTNFESTEGSIKGHAEMHYNWKFGHAPTGSSEANHVLWQRERNKKDGLRETLRISRNNHSIQSSGLIRRDIDGSTRISDTYSVRRFAKTYDFGIISQDTIHGGTNFGRKKNLQLFHESIAPAGALGAVSSVPQNVITVGVGAGQGTVSKIDNNDDIPRKQKLHVNVLVGNKEGLEYGYNVLGDFILPMNIMSGSVKSGFNSRVDTLYRSASYFTNLHHDIVGNYNETSIQGPFTEQHVGGLQYRHTDINEGSDDETSRPEGWGLVLKDHPVNGPDADGALGFIGPDYETPYPSATAQKANRYRDEHAKRPVNVRNIKTVSGSQKAGNYTNEIQLFSVSPTFQKTWAIEAYNDPNYKILPESIDNSLPNTTHYQSLFGFNPVSQGNTFGVNSNNRQADGGLISAAVVGTFATGSFVVTGSPSAPVVATGSFFLTSSPSPPTTTSNASFHMLGIEDVVESSVMVITQSNGGIYPFEIDLNSSLVNVGYASISGSTNTIFWNDMSSSLSSSLPEYTISYTVSPATRSIAVSSSTAAPSRMNSSAIVGGGGGTAGYAISFWLYFDTFGSDQQKTIYEARNVANNSMTKYIYIESGSLVFESAWVDDSGTGDAFVDAFVINNFTSSYNQSLNHFSFSHSGSMGQGDQLILYLNGVSSSVLTVDSLAQNKGSATPGPLNYVDLATTEITLFTKNNGDNSLFTAGSTGPIYLDEIVVYPEARAHTHMVELYNGGKWQPSKPGSPTMIMDFESLTVGTAITNSQIISDAGSRNNNLTASINSVGDLVPLTSSGASATIIKTPTSASFLISNAPVGGDYNLTLNLESPLGTFTNLQNASGGQNYGGSYGIADGDKLTVVDGGTTKNFFLTSSSPGDSSPNFYIEITGTSNQIYTTMRDKLNAETSTTVTFNSGSENAFFMLTASTAGAAGNTIALGESGTSITSELGLAGGLDSGSTGGIQNGNKFTYDSGGTPKSFIFSYTVQADSDPSYYIITTGSSSEIWSSLKSKIETVTGETVNTSSSGLISATFSITSSVTGSDRNKTLAETGTSITSILGMLGGTSFIPAVYSEFDNVKEIPRTDLTGSQRNIVTRFSAPGGPEIQSIGYLDAYTTTYSVHNALPFRNSSVLGSGSGEQGTIRVEDHLGLRRGLKTLRGLHMGQFGIDSQYGSVTAANYPSSGSFNKQHRNRSQRKENGPVVDLGSATQASGSIRMTDTGPSTPQSYAGGVFRIISGDGTSKAYVYRNGGGFSSGDLDGSNVVVQVNGESFETVGAQVVAAIQSSNGHQGKMTATATGTSSESTIVVVEADQIGTAGNSASITNTSCGAKFVVSPGSGVAFNNGAAFVSNIQQTLITGSNHDNAFINTPIPRSEFQYSWIRSAISSSNWEDGQHILGYAPRDGIVSSSAGYVEALVFPSASSIIGS